MRKLFLPLFLFILTFSLVLPIDAQRRRSSGTQSRSRSSGSVRVKGYFRRNGTYVRPHYRTRPNHTIIDNYSYQGIGLERVGTYTSLVGTHDYPLGIWSDPKDASRAYNTPFLGLTADYDDEEDGLLIKDVAPSAKVKKGWRVRSYRLKSATSFTDATNWDELSAAAMDADEQTIVLKGTKDDGKEFTEELSIQGPESFYGPKEEDPKSPATPKSDDGYFIGARNDWGEVPALIVAADFGIGLEKGMTIDGIRLKSQKDFTPVKVWKDVEAFLKANPADVVIVRGKSASGGAFSMVAVVNKAVLKTKPQTTP